MGKKKNVAGVELPAFGVREFRLGYRKIVDQQAKKAQPFALLNREAVEAVVVPPDLYQGLVGARQDLERLRESLPLLIQAAAAGVAIPSKTLEALGAGPEFDWSKLNAFQASRGLGATHSEEGALLASPKGVTSRAIQELDDELTYAD